MIPTVLPPALPGTASEPSADLAAKDAKGGDEEIPPSQPRTPDSPDLGLPPVSPPAKVWFS